MTTEQKRQYASDAFYGLLPLLSDAISDALAYTHDGVEHSANGYSLSDAIDCVFKMSDTEIEACLV